MEAVPERTHPTSFNIGTAAIAAFVIAIDSAEKAYLRRSFDGNDWLAPGLNVGIKSNHDATVGVLSCTSATVAATAAVVLIALHLTFGRADQPAAMGFVIGGLMTNVVDALGDGRVSEYIQPSGWPAFNYGDVAVALGVGWLSWSALRSLRLRLKPARQSPGDS